MMMNGGATVRSRKIRIIKNAPMFMLSFWRIQLEDYKQDESHAQIWLSPVGIPGYRQGCSALWIHRLTNFIG